MKHVFIYFTLFVFIFSACRKNNELSITIEGTVLNSGDQSYAAGVTVKVKFQEIGSGTVSTAYQTIASTTTDANGFYRVTFDKPAAAEYKFELSSPRHFASEFTESADNISATQTNTRNFQIDPLSWFAVHLKNVNPVTTQDMIIFQNNSESNPCSTCCNNVAQSFTGMNTDTVLVCKRKGGTRIKFSWIVQKGSSNQTYSDSVLVAPYDTSFYQLNY